MTSSRQTLSKSERLKSYKKIRILFAEGQKFRVQPLLVFYQFSTNNDDQPQQDALQMGVSVGARYFKKAVDRNLLKRRIREAYRKNNQELKDVIHDGKTNLGVFFVYAQQEMNNYQLIEIAMVKALEILREKLYKKDSPINP
jgi:ribonuclease P protein component